MKKEQKKSQLHNNHLHSAEFQKQNARNLNTSRPVIFLWPSHDLIVPRYALKFQGSWMQTQNGLRITLSSLSVIFFDNQFLLPRSTNGA